jgi:hypothetical protein
MTRAEKLLAAMKANPSGDWQIADVETVCRRHGLVITAPRAGSHFKIRKPGRPHILTIPARRPILPIYIRALVSMIEESSL